MDTFIFKVHLVNHYNKELISSGRQTVTFCLISQIIAQHAERWQKAEQMGSVFTVFHFSPEERGKRTILCGNEARIET